MIFELKCRRLMQTKPVHGIRAFKRGRKRGVFENMAETRLSSRTIKQTFKTLVEYNNATMVHSERNR